ALRIAGERGRACQEAGQAGRSVIIGAVIVAVGVAGLTAEIEAGPIGRIGRRRRAALDRRQIGGRRALDHERAWSGLGIGIGESVAEADLELVLGHMAAATVI